MAERFKVGHYRRIPASKKRGQKCNAWWRSAWRKEASFEEPLRGYSQARNAVFFDPDLCRHGDSTSEEGSREMYAREKGACWRATSTQGVDLYSAISAIAPLTLAASANRLSFLPFTNNGLLIRASQAFTWVRTCRELFLLILCFVVGLSP